MKVNNNTDKGKLRTPRYAIHLLALIVTAATVFFVGLRFFVPEGSKLTGSYDAKSLLYIADAPVAYADSASCGASSRRWRRQGIADPVELFGRFPETPLGFTVV